ncbi:MAG: hypothetical protein ACFFDI_12405, partial [Promethearchaeota archaeon]
LTLEIFDVPGHTKDHIAILDQKNKNFFVGDALGDKFTDRLIIPPFMPPFWDKKDFFASIEKVKQIEFDSICLGHFGCLYGEEARNFLDETLDTFNQWWKVFETAEEEDKLDDIDYLKDLVMKETTTTQDVIDAADFKLQKFMFKVLLGSVNSFRRLFRKKPITPAEILMPEVLEWLSNGYKISKGID